MRHVKLSDARILNTWKEEQKVALAFPEKIKQQIDKME